MGRSLELPPPHTWGARAFLASRFRSTALTSRIIGVFLLILILSHGQHLFFFYHRELGAKYSPTEFGRPDRVIWQTEDSDAELAERLLAHRSEWQVLGAGWEGITFAFNSSVIKTFVPGQSPFRNCILGRPNARWPTEIPASLEFGGVWKAEHETLENRPTSTTHQSGFLSVKAYFLAVSSPQRPPEWHLVTPLVSGGNLPSLARRLSQQYPSKTFGQLDQTYRRTFQRLLLTLTSLHQKGFCHDDIKPANIFVASDRRWILGDLGNVRHINHPYHSSRLWVDDNHQLPDCRANDVMRAFKSYLQFLRAASNNSQQFDLAILNRIGSLGRLFWRTVADASTMNATELRLRSDIEYPTQIFEPSETLAYSYVGRRWALSNVVEDLLQTRFSERRARWAALTWLFGVPVKEC